MPNSNDWLPYTIPERKVVLRVLATNIGQYAVQLGLTQADADRIGEIAEAYAFAADVVERQKVTMKALVGWRNAVMSGKRPLQTLSVRPVFDNTPAPVGTTRSLIYEIRRYVARIKASTGYAPTIGTALGILPPARTALRMEDAQPVLKVESVEGFRVRISCEMGKMSGLRVEYRRNGEEIWSEVAFLSNLPETIYIEPAVRGVPETGVMRARYFKKNKTVGIYSKMPSVTLFGA